MYASSWRDVSRVNLLYFTWYTRCHCHSNLTPDFHLLRFHRCPSSSNQIPVSRQHSPYVLISGIPGRYGLRWAKLKVFLSLFTCNSYSPCFRMTRSGYFSTRMGSWFRSRNSSEFWYQLLSIFDTSPHAKRWTRISEEQGRIELKSVSTTAFARLQSCFFDSHAHCLMMLRLTLMTRCANFRLGFETKIASRNHYHLYTPFPYNSLFL